LLYRRVGDARLVSQAARITQKPCPVACSEQGFLNLLAGFVLVFSTLRIVDDSSLDIALNPVLAFLVMRTLVDRLKVFLGLLGRVLHFIHS
jgi:hypothetical protein